MAKITLNKTFRHWLDLWTDLSQSLNSMFTELYANVDFEYKLVVLLADVANAHATPNTLLDITGLEFPVLAGKTYKFRALIPYTSAATTTGSRFTITGPVTPTRLNYTSRYTITATTETFNYATAYQIPAACNTGSLADGNLAIVEGIIKPSINGTVKLQFASEITASAITAKAGAFLEYKKII